MWNESNNSSNNETREQILKDTLRYLNDGLDSGKWSGIFGHFFKQRREVGLKLLANTCEEINKANNKDELHRCLENLAVNGKTVGKYFETSRAMVKPEPASLL